jgi:hypothetical protein
MVVVGKEDRVDIIEVINQDYYKMVLKKKHLYMILNIMKNQYSLIKLMKCKLKQVDLINHR